MAERKILTVTELTRKIKLHLEQNPEFNDIEMTGEVSNVTYHSSGHIYLTLKDENAVISATFFKYANKNLSFTIEEGMSLSVTGSVTLYEKRGGYQFNIKHAEKAGQGELLKRIEELKKRLAAEGMFDQEKKQKLPYLPVRIGVVTSPTGAAIQDILKVALKRFPALSIILAPAKVQGDDAPVTIVRAIEELNKPEYNIDIIIAGRGGGSFEDLMPFNDEKVVRAFGESRIPIISAVGHQIDSPLSDLAADVYAATPSHGAELAVPDIKEIRQEIDYAMDRITRVLTYNHTLHKKRLEHILNKPVMKSPFKILEMRELWLSDAEQQFIIAAKTVIQKKKERIDSLSYLPTMGKTIVNTKKHRFNMAMNSLEKLSPLKTMARGYSVIQSDDEKTISSIEDVTINQDVSARLRDGTLHCTVNRISRRDEQ